MTRQEGSHPFVLDPDNGKRSGPVLQAAHIRSFSEEGPNTVDNGVLVRLDIHALFDGGAQGADQALLDRRHVLEGVV